MFSQPGACGTRSSGPVLEIDLGNFTAGDAADSRLRVPFSGGTGELGGFGHPESNPFDP